VKNADGPSEETVRNSTTLKTQRQHKLKCWHNAWCHTICSFFVRPRKHKLEKIYTNMWNHLKNVSLCRKWKQCRASQTPWPVCELFLAEQPTNAFLLPNIATYEELFNEWWPNNVGLCLIFYTR
jgi:hypothetical protein